MAHIRLLCGTRWQSITCTGLAGCRTSTVSNKWKCECGIFRHTCRLHASAGHSCQPACRKKREKQEPLGGAVLLERPPKRLAPCKHDNTSNDAEHIACITNGPYVLTSCSVLLVVLKARTLAVRPKMSPRPVSFSPMNPRNACIVRCMTDLKTFSASCASMLKTISPRSVTNTIHHSRHIAKVPWTPGCPMRRVKGHVRSGASVLGSEPLFGSLNFSCLSL